MNLLQIELFPKLNGNVNKWKDKKRIEIKKEEQEKFLRRCVEEGVTPNGLLVKKKGVKCNTVRWNKLLKQLNKELVWFHIRKLKYERTRLSKENEIAKKRIEDDSNIFVREYVMKILQHWENNFRSKERERLKEKGRRIGWREEENETAGNKKRVVILGDTKISEEEEKFLSLGYKFKVSKMKVDITELVYETEEALQEIEDIEKRKKMRKRMVALVNNVPKKNKTNLKEEERKGMLQIRNRKDIVIEQADKGGAVVVMEKNWYKMKLEELNDNTYEELGNISEVENIKMKVIEECKKKGFKKWIREKGRIPVMKGFPKIHKKVLKLRPVLDCKDNFMEGIENKIKTIAEVLREMQVSKRVVNSKEVIELLNNLGRRPEATVMFSIDVKSMFPSLNRSEILNQIDLLMENRKIEEWNKGKLKKALRCVWDCNIFTLGDKVMRAKEGLIIGSCISPVLADIIMNKWECEVLEKGGDRLMLFCRYVDDCLGIWKGTKRQLKTFVEDLEDRAKGISLEIEIEDEKKLNFLDMTIEKTLDGEFKTSWYQKECAAGIYCHKRSDVDDWTKNNFISNMENRIKFISKQKNADLNKFWNQLKENGYTEKDREVIIDFRNRMESKAKDEKEEEEKKKRRKWYGIESGGIITEKIKHLLRKEGVKTYRRGGNRILDIVRKKTKRKINEGTRGVVYKVRCTQCDQVYIGETKKTLGERLRQHQDDVRLMRENNAIFRHVFEHSHNIDWEGATIIEQEERLIIRKWKEARRIREEGEKVMNFNKGLEIDEQWRKILKKRT
jgi:hypothetical protein